MLKAPVFKRYYKLSYYFTGSLFLLLSLLLTACGPEPIEDLSDTSYELLDQDSTAVTFPDDFEGELVVLGYIYTNCPDICSMITANMSSVYEELDDREGIHFVGITFDPQRDTPSVLKSYMKSFNLDEERFTYLTGDSAAVNGLMQKIGIRSIVTDTTGVRNGRPNYLINHTDQINLMDRYGRIIQEYGGSQVPPEHILEDIEKFR
jgi:protein SCO1